MTERTGDSVTIIMRLKRQTRATDSLKPSTEGLGGVEIPSSSTVLVRSKTDLFKTPKRIVNKTHIEERHQPKRKDVMLPPIHDIRK